MYHGGRWWAHAYGWLGQWCTLVECLTLVNGRNSVEGGVVGGRWRSQGSGHHRWDPGYEFQTVAGHNFENATTTEQNPTYSIVDCQDICRSNCNCTGFQQIHSNGTGCIFFSAGAYTLDGAGEDFYMLGNLTQHNDKSTA
ncbi:hypothetical protein E2542_SST04531 [Spatholobus suberectus]|nr:hypothetical protein E2542_SST04531 [Spatholobus suberectus]